MIYFGISACTYSPEERRVVIDQVVRSGDTYTAYVLVESKVFRSPTGFLNTFPNGGVPRILSQEVKVYEVHAKDRVSRLLAELSANDATWESFSGHFVGFDDQNNLYLQLSGCEKGGDCYDVLINHRHFRIDRERRLEPITKLPSEIGLPGIMLARRQGEVNYVRFSIRRDTLKAKFQEDGDYTSVFVTDKEGMLLPVN
ncbi:hypothetical protein [Rhodohalobacter halophilus]|uniref:hypothetical protein n=1 Tax=Rhodohalobacter halophilus TaxID=1812810 RepID=UPI00114D06BC|nr:hypothetical protein [Rhodohalobacter halophilus]